MSAAAIHVGAKPPTPKIVAHRTAELLDSILPWGVSCENRANMLEVISVSISCALSVLAAGIAMQALRTADPAEVRRVVRKLRLSMDEVETKLADLEAVAIPRMEAQCEAILEKADLRFDSAENKRKSIAARQRHNAGDPAAGGNGGIDVGDESISRADRKAAVERAYRGG